MTGGSNGYRTALVRHQFRGLISLFAQDGQIAALYLFDSSEEFMGKLGLGQFGK